MMKLMTLKQYMSMSKPALIRKIMKTLRAMPKKRLAVLCYNITRSKLPRLSLSDKQSLKRIKDWDKLSPSGLTMKQVEAQSRKDMPKVYEAIERYEGKVKRKKKRKFSAKQLAAQRLFAKRARAGTLKRRRR